MLSRQDLVHFGRLTEDQVRSVIEDRTSYDETDEGENMQQAVEECKRGHHCSDSDVEREPGD
jgi:hypothetical protein